MSNSDTKWRGSLVVYEIILFLLISPSTVFAQFVGTQYDPRAFSQAPVGTKAVDFKVDRMSKGIATIVKTKRTMAA